MTRLARRLACATLVSLLSGCDEAALDLVLTPTPNLDTDAQVRAKVRSIVVVLDTPGGLYHPGEEASENGGALRIVDWDGDPSDLELVASVGMPEGRLPRVRVRRGGLADVPLDVRVLGYASSTDPDPVVVAEGRLLGARIGGSRSELSMPFDLLATERPPRVSEVATLVSTCDEVRVVVRFERAIDPATLLGPGSVVILPSSSPSGLSVDASGREATVVGKTTLFPAEQKRFALEIRPTVLGADGVPLDQVPSLDGAQAFQADFTVPCRSGGGA